LDGQIHDEESDDEEDEEDDEMSEEKKDAKYLVNGLFGTVEDNSSMVRVVLSTKSETAIKVCDQVMSWKICKREDLSFFRETKKVSDFVQEGTEKKEVCQVIRNLVYNGVLVVVQQS